MTIGSCFTIRTCEYFCEMRAQRLGRYNHKRTAFLLCDVQEKFKQTIHVFPSVVSVSKTLIAASRIFEIPLIVTEQKPTALGHTGLLQLSLLSVSAVHSVVEELSALLDAKQDKIYPKTQFSMVIPEVKADLADVDSVVLFGIEVPRSFSRRLALQCRLMSASCKRRSIYWRLARRCMWLWMGRVARNSGKDSSHSTYAMWIRIEGIYCRSYFAHF